MLKQLLVIYTSIDKFKIKAQKQFEENIAKPSKENFKQGKNKQNSWHFETFYKVIRLFVKSIIKIEKYRNFSVIKYQASFVNLKILIYSKAIYNYWRLKIYVVLIKK